MSCQKAVLHTKLLNLYNTLRNMASVYAIFLLLQLSRLGDARQCEKVTFKIQPSAENLDFGDAFQLANSTSVVEFVTHVLETGDAPTNGFEEVAGSFEIAGVYCKPTGASQVEQDRNSLQILLHGNTYNSLVWEGYGCLPTYSWAEFANSHGFATLALDMLGHGASSHPAPDTILQLSLEASAIHSVVKLLHSGNNALGRAFDHLTFVGHSYGSITGSAIARMYPEDFDSMVLTAFSSQTIFPSPNLDLRAEPAAGVSPKFRGLNSGHLTSTTQCGVESAFYAGAFDPAVVAVDFRHHDILTVGEIGSVTLGFQTAEDFKGNILLVTGDQDRIFCPISLGTCRSILNQTKQLFPQADHFDFHIPSETGHTIMLHRSAQNTFSFVTNWLIGIESPLKVRA